MKITEMNGKQLKELRGKSGITQGKLSEETGIPLGTIGRIESSGEDIKKVDVLNKLKKYFKIESVDDKTDEGEMFSKELFDHAIPESRVGNTLKETPRPRENARSLSSLWFEYTDDKFREVSPGRFRMKVKFVDQKAKAGYLSGFIDREYMEGLKDHEVTVNTFHKGNYQAFEIDGDSMDDRTIDCIPHGTIVTGREIPYDAWRSKLHTHKWPNFVFIHKTEGIIAKRIVNQDIENGILTLHSLNPNKELYPDFDVEMDDLYQIFNIVKRELPG